MSVTRQAAVLVGGAGTRLGALTTRLPKPLLPVSGKPFLDAIILQLARFGYDDVLLLAGHLGTEFLENYDGRTMWGCRIRVLLEPHPRGTAGALRQHVSYLASSFLLLNGDSLFDINLLDSFFRDDDGEWLIKIAIGRVQNADRFGAVALEGQVIKHMEEKGASGPGSVNMGVYMIRKHLIEGVPLAAASSLERDILPRLVAERRALGKAFDASFVDIGVPESYRNSAPIVRAASFKPAIFFDRDGTLNWDDGYVYEPNRLRWIPGAMQAVARVTESGCYAFVVTNQAGVARGMYQVEHVHFLHDVMNEQLRAVGGNIAQFYYCPTHPDGVIPEYSSVSVDRKPGPGMILRALHEWPVDASASILFGDSDTDVAAARAAGIRGEKVSPGELCNAVSAFLEQQRLVRARTRLSYPD